MIDAPSNRSIHADHSADQPTEGGHASGSIDHPAVVVDGPAPPLMDPVCGMTVSVDSPHVLHHEGRPVYFCSSGCKAKFVANPAKYQVARPESKAPP
ncbi:MAG: YHS domain-containing protein, partial [Pseudomonadota bacterium]|nr:YHS domain-containing protein [Pseudomonadota bacterium]